jgi:hypothetical protein
MAHNRYNPGPEGQGIDPSPSRIAIALESAQPGASNAWAVSDVIPVEHARWIAFWIKLSIDSSATAAQGQIRIMASAETDQPAIGDDSWYALSVTDATPTPTVLIGTVATGEDMTMQPEWGVHIVYPMALTLGAASDADTDEIRLHVECRCASARWIYVAYHELGDATDATAFEIKYNTGY